MADPSLRRGSLRRSERARGRRRCRRASPRPELVLDELDVAARRVRAGRPSTSTRRAAACQPGSVSYTGAAAWKSLWCAGKSRRLGAVAQPVAGADRELGERRRGRRASSARAGRSRSPAPRSGARRGRASRSGGSRPVTVPYSWPISRTRSWSGPSISVGNGPSPTRVTYAFATPMMRSSRPGPTPTPVAAFAATGFDEVTNGYVPWSRSSSVACAPSKRTTLPSRSALST